MKRLPFIVCAMALVGFPVSMTLAGDPQLPPSCVAEPTVNCLGDAAFQLAQAAPERWKVEEVATDLARIEHFDQASALASLAQPSWGAGFARMFILSAIARQRVAMAARRAPSSPADLGPIEDLATIRDFPSDPRTSAYYLASLDLLGRHPSDSSSDPFLHAAEERTWTFAGVAKPSVNAMAARMEELIPELPDSLRPSAWLDLAELRALSGDAAGAERAFRSALPARIIPYSMIGNLLLAMQPSEVLSILKAHGVERAHYHIAAAAAMRRRGESPVAIEAVLRRAFDLAIKGERGRPDFEQQRLVVGALIDMGNREAAIELARLAAPQVSDRRGAFPWEGLLTAAAIFNDLADRDSAFAMLESAVASFPRNRSQVLGVGVVAGPVTFSNWGVGDSAHSQAAAQFYRLGDMPRFEENLAMVTTNYRLQAWFEILAEAGPAAELARAESDVRPELRRTLVERAAAIQMDRGNQQSALSLARRLVDEASRPAAPSDYSGLETAARIALLAGDMALADDAVGGLVHAAISSNDPEKLSEAAAFWASRLPEARP